MKPLVTRWTALVALNVVTLSIFGAYQWCGAQSTGGQLPFANSNEQRSNIMRDVSEIKALLQEQNALLKEGAAKNAATKR